MQEPSKTDTENEFSSCQKEVLESITMGEIAQSSYVSNGDLTQNSETSLNGSQSLTTKKREKYRPWTEEKVRLAYQIFSEPENNKKSAAELSKLIGVSPTSLIRFRRNLANGREFVRHPSGRRPNLKLQPCLEKILAMDNTMPVEQMKQFIPEPLKCCRKTILQNLKSMGYVSKRLPFFVETNVNTTEIIDQRYHYSMLIKDIPMEKLVFLNQVEIYPNGIFKRVWVRENEPLTLKYDKDRIFLLCIIGINGILRYDIRLKPYDAQNYECFLLKNLNHPNFAEFFFMIDPTNITINFQSQAFDTFSGKIILMPPHSQQLNPAHLFLRKLIKEFDKMPKDGAEYLSQVLELIQTMDMSLIKEFFNFSHKILFNTVMQGKPLLMEH